MMSRPVFALVTRVFAALATLAALPASTRAQAASEASTAHPERPTVATHAFAVARGYLELEAGAARTQIDGGREHAAGLTAKVGVAERVQLTVTASLTRSVSGVTGADPAFAGVKWQMNAEHEGAPVVAVLPGVTFANGPRRDRTTALSLLAIFSQSIDGVDMDLNIEATRLNDVTGRLPYLWAASFGGPVAGVVGWGLEASGTGGESSDTRLLGYLAFTVKPSLVLDAGGWTSTTGARASQLFAGLTWNVGRIAGKGGVSERSRVAARSF